MNGEGINVKDLIVMRSLWKVQQTSTFLTVSGLSYLMTSCGVECVVNCMKRGGSVI